MESETDLGKKLRLTRDEILSYLTGVYQKGTQTGAISLSSSKRHHNLIFSYTSSKEKYPLELVLDATYLPGSGDKPDIVSITPYGINQEEAKRFLEHHVNDDSIFGDSGDLRGFKKDAHTWKNILERAKLSSRENAKTICYIINKNVDPWQDVLPAIKGYMVQPWIVFLAHHMHEPQ